MVTTEGQWAKFSFYRPQATCVSLAGDFTGWSHQHLRMIRKEDGYWVAVLRLTPGIYRFKYLVDGEWFCDYGAFGIEYGPFGPHSTVRIQPEQDDDDVNFRKTITHATANAWR